jgi:hypothetical protein
VSARHHVAPALLMAAVALDPFLFFQPTVRLEPRERETLATGRAVARTMPAPDGHVGIFAAVAADIDGARLVRWMRDIAALKRSPRVKEIGRFSDPPRIEDLEALTLDAADADEIARCRIPKCGVKLEPAEIEAIRRAMQRERTATGPGAQRAFREVVLARTRRYLEVGRRAVPVPQFLLTNWPEVGRDVGEYPRRVVPGSERFLYWAKDDFGGKPIVSVTHVTIVRGDGEARPDVLVVGRQVFGTHYVNGAWSVTALMRSSPRNYLAYVNQTEIDLLDSWYGGLVRRVVQRRLRDEAVGVLDGLRRRLESGDPPARSGV